MNAKESLEDRLPYYWDGNNIDSFMSIIGSSFDDTKVTLGDIRATRRIKQINGEEKVAQDQHLDNLAENVGQHRDVVKFIDDKLDIDVESENDEMFRRRILWNIKLQESDGFLEQIKDLLTEGLIMYRVRTGLGGYVPRDPVKADDFLTDIPPKWDVPEDQNMGDRRYIEPSDVYTFHNQETRLGMSAPDSWHGKHGNLTNYYEIHIPWMALPWTEGEESLIWKSQDDFPRPWMTTFTKSDLTDNILTVEHDLDNEYPMVEVVNSSDQHVRPTNIQKTSEGLEIDLSKYSISDDNKVRVTGYGYHTTIKDSDLEDGVATIKHNLSIDYPNVAIYDNNDELVGIDNITYIDSDAIEVNFGGSIAGTWHITVVGGEDVVTELKKFTSSDIEDDSLIVEHDISAEAMNVTLLNNVNNRPRVRYIEELPHQKIKVKFAPTTTPIEGTWTLRLSVSRYKVPEDENNGWSNGVWTGREEELHVEPLQKLADLTRPAATDVGLRGYGGVVWKSQEDFDDPTDPPEDKHHGWGARWDGDIEETAYAMENLDDFWVDY